MLKNVNGFLDNNIINSLINYTKQKNVLNNLDTDRIIKDMKTNDTQLTI